MNDASFLFYSCFYFFQLSADYNFGILSLSSGFNEHGHAGHPVVVGYLAWSFACKIAKGGFTGLAGSHSYGGDCVGELEPLCISGQTERDRITVSPGQLQKVDISRLKSVHIIRPDSQGLKFRYDEFGTPTTLYNHNILAVVSCALREINKERLVIEDIKYDSDRNLFIYRFQGKADPARTFQYLIRISEGLKNEPIPAADIIVDMNRLYESGGPLGYLRL